MVSLEPRTRLSCAAGSPRISRSSNRTLPLARAPWPSNPIAAMSIWVLPDPDSPTMPTHSPGRTARDAARTAATFRSARANSTLRFSMAKTGVKGRSPHP